MFINGLMQSMLACPMFLFSLSLSTPVRVLARVCVRARVCLCVCVRVCVRGTSSVNLPFRGFKQQSQPAPIVTLLHN